MHRILRTGASALVLSSVVLAGCGPSDELESAANEATFPVYSGEELPDIAVEDLKFDTVEDHGSRVEFVGDVLVSVEEDDSEWTSEMTAVDPTDGSTLWQLESEGREDLVDEADSSRVEFFFDLMGTGHDGSILVPYETTFCAEYDDCTEEEHMQGRQAREQGLHLGVVALDPADGSALSSQSMTMREDSLVEYIDVSAAGSTPDALILNVMARSAEDGEFVNVVVGLDPEDGDGLWTAEGFGATRVEGDVVVARGVQASDEDGRRIALDAGTGERMWEQESDEAESWGSDYLPREDGTQVTVLGETNEVGGSVGVVDLATGAVLERTGVPYMGIALGGDEDEWLAAWVDGDEDEGVLHTLGSGETVQSRGEHELEDLEGGAYVAGVSADGYIWIVEPGEETPTTYAVDRTGAKRSEEIDGALTVLGDGSLLIAEDDHPDVTKTHRLWSYGAA